MGYTSRIPLASHVSPPSLIGDVTRVRPHRLTVSSRSQRRLARWVRRTANSQPSRDPVRRRQQLMLHDRVVAVRTDLLEIAEMLVGAQDPDPSVLADLQRLLADGCGSPLYDETVHVSELRAALHFVHSGLARGDDNQTRPVVSRGQGRADASEGCLARLHVSHEHPPTPRESAAR